MGGEGRAKKLLARRFSARADCVADDTERPMAPRCNGAVCNRAALRSRGNEGGERERERTSRLRSDPRAETLKRGSRVGRSGEERRDR